MHGTGKLYGDLLQNKHNNLMGHEVFVCSLIIIFSILKTGYQTVLPRAL